MISLIGLLFSSLLLLLPAGTSAEEPAYVGVEQCMMCHLPHYKSWDETRMSKAFDLLKPGIRAEAKVKAGIDPGADFTKEAFCIECHATGFGKPGGFVDVETTPELAGVQCEMCHGPGSIYSKMMVKKKGTYTLEDYKKTGGLTMPSEENNICMEKCHNKNSPFVYTLQFNFEDRKAIGTHRHDLRYIYLPFDI